MKQAILLSGLHTANLSWQTRVGKPKLVCVNGRKTSGKHVCKLLVSNRNVFADCFYAVHTHQLEFANTSLPCEDRFTCSFHRNALIHFFNCSIFEGF